MTENEKRSIYDLYWADNETRLKLKVFVIFRTIAKIFETFSQDIINECRINLPSVTDIISKQKIHFLVRYSASENLLCKVFESNTEREIKTMRQTI